MNDVAAHINFLFTAELQFRLSSAVRIATTGGGQPLDLPRTWSHGKHTVQYEEIELSKEQADFAACFMKRSATFLMAVAMKDAIKAVVPDPKNAVDSDVKAAYQISRLVRNSFAHRPFQPIWSIDPDCCNKVFEVKNIISLDTTDLDKKVFDWHHYGGPLAMLRLCRYVRFDILKDNPQSPKRFQVTNEGRRIVDIADYTR